MATRHRLQERTLSSLRAGLDDPPSDRRYRTRLRQPEVWRPLALTLATPSIDREPHGRAGLRGSARRAIHIQRHLVLSNASVDRLQSRSAAWRYRRFLSGFLSLSTSTRLRPWAKCSCYP